ncbi:MAG: hypothetical protein EPN97_09440 [Alphaproteobacteria bacterium]|nr:MAG: hypothetical protein EPN97_09440 [Alphaproteobacteria bacterium]
MKATRNILMLARLFALSACMSMKSTQPPATIYVMHSVKAAARENSRPAALPVVVVAEPVVPSGFNTDRIALYLAGGRRLDYYAGAAWPEPLGKLLQGFIIQSVQGAIADTPEGGFAAAYRLQVRVNDLEPVYAAGPEVAPQLKVSMTFRLVSLKQDRVLLDITRQRTASAAANTLTGVTAGLEALLQSVMSDALKEISPHLRGAPAKPQQGITSQ